MVDVGFLMNSDVKTLNFCSPTIEKVLLQPHHISGEGKRGSGGGGGGGGVVMGADVKRNIPRFC